MELIWLAHPDCQQVSLVGGKAANLSRLQTIHPVPPAFCITTVAFTRWADAVQAEALPTPLSTMLAEAYTTLAVQSNQATPAVAVRSSAVDEDGQAASYAGQYESYLNQQGITAVEKAVARCWATTQSIRTQHYRAQQGRLNMGGQIAVLVQQMVRADVAAIAFSANPITGNRDEVIIDANWGLGESIVGGLTNPDNYCFDKTTQRIKQQRIGQKEQMTILSTEGTEMVPVPRLLRKQPALQEAQLVEIAQLAQKLEETLGWPVDIECAYAANQLYLLQCRPITTLTR